MKELHGSRSYELRRNCFGKPENRIILNFLDLIEQHEPSRARVNVSGTAASSEPCATYSKTSGRFT